MGAGGTKACAVATGGVFTTKKDLVNAVQRKELGSTRRSRQARNQGGRFTIICKSQLDENIKTKEKNKEKAAGAPDEVPVEICKGSVRARLHVRN